MIKKTTTFVLGAGASCCFGFPTGAELREKICNLSESAGNPSARRIFDIGLKNINNPSSDFLNSFRKSAVPSIDSFLARRQGFDEIGKLAIAACLMSAENEDNLNSVGSKQGNSDWYGYLWEHMLEGCFTTDELLKNNRVTFVSFNYDRSLEIFLHNAIKHTFRLSDEDANSISSQFTVHHVHGSLGKLKPETIAFHYGTFKIDEDDYQIASLVRHAIESLRVIPAARDKKVDGEVFYDLKSADQIIFLGYGFDPQNNEKLGMSDLLKDIQQDGLRLPDLYATHFGLTPSEKEHAFKSIFGVHRHRVNGASSPCLEALRAWGTLLNL